MLDEHPPGMIVVPCHDLARYHQFTVDLRALDVPEGTVVSFQRSASIVQNLNRAVESLLDSGLAWAFFLGDDHTFGSSLLRQMLNHDLDIVGPLCVTRTPPFKLVHYASFNGRDDRNRPRYTKLDWDALPEHGLVEVVASGMPGMLVRRDVFKRLDPPWFRNSDTFSANEDTEWCGRVRDLGFKVMIDVDVQIGHFATAVCWPHRHEGAWGLLLDLQGQKLFLPGGFQGEAEEHRW